MQVQTHISEAFLMDERWSPVLEHYLISTLGRVKSLRTGKIMAPLKTTTGYHQIQLSVKGKKSQFKIHRLVALAFIPNPNKKPEVNHKDGNSINNRAENLEWVNKSENAKHAYDTGLNKKIRAVVSMDLNGNHIMKYKSARDAEKDGYSNQLIAKCCSGKRKTHMGRMWKYA